MGMIREFRDFAVKGNVVDMAVGIIIGGAFGGIVTSLVNDMMMPPLGWIIGKVDFSKLSVRIPVPGEGGAPVEIFYGKFINAGINFVIVAFALFLLVKAINVARRQEAAAPAPPPGPTPDQKLLGEIRDLLKAGR